MMAGQHLSLIDLQSRLAPQRSRPVAKKKWIAGATANSHGQFRRKAEAAGESTREFAKEKENAPGKLGKQARLAETLMGMHGGGKKKSRRSALYGKGD
jgi:hypothetical protein